MHENCRDIRPRNLCFLPQTNFSKGVPLASSLKNWIRFLVIVHVFVFVHFIITCLVKLIPFQGPCYIVQQSPPRSFPSYSRQNNPTKRCVYVPCLHPWFEICAMVTQPGRRTLQNLYFNIIQRPAVFASYYIVSLLGIVKQSCVQL